MYGISMKFFTQNWFNKIDPKLNFKQNIPFSKANKCYFEPTKQCVQFSER